MDIYAENFSIKAAFEENADATVKALSAALSEQLQQTEMALDKGLAPQDYTQAQHLRAALMAAHGIITLRHSNITKQK